MSCTERQTLNIVNKIKPISPSFSSIIQQLDYQMGDQSLGNSSRSLQISQFLGAALGIVQSNVGDVVQSDALALVKRISGVAGEASSIGVGALALRD